MVQEILTPGGGAGGTTHGPVSRLALRALLFALGLGTSPRRSPRSPLSPFWEEIWTYGMETHVFSDMSMMWTEEGTAHFW
jgi:hypothetical protein